MALDRTWFNTLVDDSGSGTDGTIWNKAQIDNLLDVIDGGFAAGAAATVIGNADTGTINNWAPGLVGNTFIHWTGVADLTIAGLTQGVQGQSVTIKNQSSASVIYTRFNSGLSIPGTRFYNIVTSSMTPIASGGFATYTWVTAVGMWVLTAHEQGAWITSPYSAAHFAAAAGTWTVGSSQRILLASYLKGTALSVSFMFDATTVSTANTTLYIQAAGYGGFSGVGVYSNRLAYVTEASAVVLDGGFLRSGGNSMGLYKPDAGNWAAAGATTHVEGSITFAVV